MRVQWRSTPRKGEGSATLPIHLVFQLHCYALLEAAALARPEYHREHTSVWYSFWGKPPRLPASGMQQSATDCATGCWPNAGRSPAPSESSSHLSRGLPLACGGSFHELWQGIAPMHRWGASLAYGSQDMFASHLLGPRPSMFLHRGCHDSESASQL
jgi:hypothetical protein